MYPELMNARLNELAAREPAIHYRREAEHMLATARRAACGETAPTRDQAGPRTLVDPR